MYGVGVVAYTAQDAERRTPETSKPGDERDPWEIDRARILHSAAFRRLQRKTQVFAPAAGDFFRTRLTHSIEVSQIAKGIALRVGADPTLCEAASLAHDIGHPPFGHAGESVLNECMAQADRRRRPPPGLLAQRLQRAAEVQAFPQ